MTEKLVKTSIASSVKEVIESSVKTISVEKAPKRGKSGAKKDDYKGVVEAVLRGLATRIVLTHSFKDLGKTLADTITTVRAGGMDANKIDLVKGQVLDTVKKIKDGKEGEAISKFLDEHFRLGKYEEAADFLKKMANDPETGLSPTDKTETIDILGKVKKESSTTPTELDELAVKRDEVRESNQDKVSDLVKKSDEIQIEVGREEMNVLIKNEEPEEVETTQTVNEATRVPIIDELAVLTDFEKADAKFVVEVLTGQKGSGDKVLDFATMDRKVVYHVWYRTAGILARDDWSGAPETRALLIEMNKSARRALLENATTNLVLEGMTPGEARWQALPKDEQDLVLRNFGFIENGHGDFRELLRHADGFSGDEFEANGLDRDRLTRTDLAMFKLIEEYSKTRPSFQLEQKLRRNDDTNKWEWVGLPGQSKQQIRVDMFDVCRDEVYNIQGQLTQENMGNLVFEDSAQKYLALMRIDVGDDLELESVKDAITKALYIEFSVKTMWRSGGNIEGWQRGASVLTQDSEKNFFQLMQIGEMLKVKNKEGESLEIGRFNWEDLMTVAEMKAENGQYYLTYMAGQSEDLRGKRKPEFAAAVAELVLKKRILKGEITQAQATALIAAAREGNYNFEENARQVRSMVDYMQFLEVATFRGGEFGLNDSTVPGKFNMVSLPCGEVVQKTGPWSVIYDWYYPVTKYGGEWVGKLFLPNVNILSYRRGETLAHFIAKDSKVAAGMLDKAGNYHETGMGAKEFFFGGNDHDATYSGGVAIGKVIYDEYGNVKTDTKNGSKATEAGEFNQFWASVIFDVRTGGAFNKTAINRTVDSIRVTGSQKLVEWGNAGRLGFVEHMDFENFERMVGHTIPGASKIDKFKWMTENFDYSFWRKDTLPSKGVGDWVGKYVPKKYEDARTKLQAFLNAPGTATLGAVRDIISEYSDESTFNEQAQAVLKDNRKFTMGWRMVDKDGNEEGTLGYDSSTGKRKLVGYKHADRNKSKWIQEGAGDSWGVTEQWHSPTEGYHMGSGLAMSRQQGKELFRDPMYFEKMEIDNQFHAGVIPTREEWGRRKREFQMKAYFGDQIGESKFRLGYIPVLTPFFLFRGWWVDRMQLDWEDFMIVMHKNNEETWEKLKKMLGI